MKWCSIGTWRGAVVVQETMPFTWKRGRQFPFIPDIFHFHCVKNPLLRCGKTSRVMWHRINREWQVTRTDMIYFSPSNNGSSEKSVNSLWHREKRREKVNPRWRQERRRKKNIRSITQTWQLLFPLMSLIFDAQCVFCNVTLTHRHTLLNAKRKLLVAVNIPPVEAASASDSVRGRCRLTFKWICST